jgi:hypothetical protein
MILDALLNGIIFVYALISATFSSPREVFSDDAIFKTYARFSYFVASSVKSILLFKMSLDQNVLSLFSVG